METDERILIAAKELFWKYGIKSITMDDIGKELGMSKKTIYQCFADKEVIVKAITNQEISLRQTECDFICKKSKNAIHEILLMMVQMSDMFGKMHARLFYDLQKYHPESWNLFIQHKENYILPTIENNLNRGIGEGLYRKSLNIKIMARLRAYQVEMAFNPMIFPNEKFSIGEVQMQMIDHFLHGIATEKGHKMIIKYQHKDENK